MLADCRPTTVYGMNTVGTSGGLAEVITRRSSI